MRFRLSLLALPVILLAGCGGSYSASSSTNPDTFSGDWAVAAHSTTFVGRTTNIGGSLNNSNGTVTGTLHVTNLPSCYAVSTNVPVTGTLSSSNVLTVTSSSVSGQVLTFTGTVTGAGTTGAVINSGSYSFTGGCNTGDNGTITAYLAPTYTSPSYSGTLSGSAASSFTLMLTNTGADANGFFDTTITSATFTGSSCFTSVGSTQAPGLIAGNYLDLPITFTSPASTLTLTGNATDSTGKTINGTYTISSTSGSCNGDTGNFSMTHP